MSTGNGIGLARDGNRAGRGALPSPQLMVAERFASGLDEPWSVKTARFNRPTVVDCVTTKHEPWAVMGASATGTFSVAVPMATTDVLDTDRHRLFAADSISVSSVDDETAVAVGRHRAN